MLNVGDTADVTGGQTPQSPTAKDQVAGQPAYAQLLSDHSYCIYLKDELASVHAVELLSCVLTGTVSIFIDFKYVEQMHPPSLDVHGGKPGAHQRTAPHPPTTPSPRKERI